MGAPVPLACLRFGRGPALVFLHGLFGSGRNWRGFARPFADRWTCLLPDLRAHGDSPHARPVDYPAMAGDVAALLEREGFAEAVLVGHSMGGKTAMMLALSRPWLVRRLIVLDIAPVRYADHDHRPLIRALRALDLARVRHRRDADRALAAAVPDPALRAFLLQNLVLDDRGARWRLDLAALEDHMPDLLDFPVPAGAAPYPGPTLFVRGDRSDYVRDAHRPAIARLFPRARVATLAGAGHWLHVTHPRELAATLAVFLGESARARVRGPSGTAPPRSRGR